MVQKTSVEKLREISLEVAEVHSQHLMAWAKLKSQAIKFAALIYEMAEVSPPRPPETWAWTSQGIPSRLIEAVGDARGRMLQPHQGGPERVGDELAAVAVILSGAAKFKPEMSSMERLRMLVSAFAGTGEDLGPEDRTENMSYKEAIAALKSGKEIARKSWPGGEDRMSYEIGEQLGDPRRGAWYKMNVTSRSADGVVSRISNPVQRREFSAEDRSATDWFVVGDSGAANRELPCVVRIVDNHEPDSGISMSLNVDGFSVATASADSSHISNTWLSFQKGREGVRMELKDALRNRLRGVLKRFTTVDCAPGTTEGVWVGRILVMQRSHISAHSVRYDFSTGETGPESLDESVRNAFRRCVHDSVLSGR